MFSAIWSRLAIKVIIVKGQSFLVPFVAIFFYLIEHSSWEIPYRPIFINYFYSNDLFMFIQNNAALISFVLLSRSVYCFWQNRYSFFWLHCQNIKRFNILTNINKDCFCLPRIWNADIMWYNKNSQCRPVFVYRCSYHSR